MKAKLAWLIPLCTLSILCIVLKLMISYWFPISRFLLFIFVPLLAILLIVFLARVENLRMKRVLSCSIIGIASVLFSVMPVDRQLELARFQVSKNLYNSAVKAIEQDISQSQDAVDASYNLKYPYSLLSPQNTSANYYKNGNSIAISFRASSSLSIVRYYVYFSDQRAKNLFEHPEQISKKYQAGSFCNRLENLDDLHWAYVFTWGDDMVPKEPDL